MTTRVQALRSSTTGAVPAVNTRLPGEVWTNFPDLQLGVIDASKTAQKLIAVRFFSTTANYAAGDFVVQGGKLYFAKASITAGAFNATQWTQVAALTDIPALYVLPTASTSVLGGVKVDGATITINSGVISSAGLVTVSSVAPSPVQNGALWYDLVGGQLYAWVNDGTSSQWVVAVNQSISGVYLPLAGGALTGPLQGTTAQFSGVVTAGADPVAPLDLVTKRYSDLKLLKAGVTDGSDALAGQIGEVISSVVTTGVPVATTTFVNVTSISLTAGDWDVSGEIWFSVGVGAPSTLLAAINTAVALPANGLNTARTQLNVAFQVSTTNNLPVRTCRVSLAAPTTYYLIAYAVFPSGVVTATGNIIARRAR